MISLCRYLLLILLLSAAVFAGDRAVFASPVACDLKITASLGGCDNVFVGWFSQRLDVVSQTLAYSDGFSPAIVASDRSYSRTGVGCSYHVGVTVTQTYAGGSACSASYADNHNRPCDQCGGSGGGGGGGGSVAGSVSVVNAASYAPTVTPDSIGAAFTSGDVTTVTSGATTLPLPEDLRGVRVKVAGQFVPLFFVSPRQVNFHIPAWVGWGLQSVEVYASDGISPDGRIFTGSVFVNESAPALFTFSNTGEGDAAAIYIPTGGPLYVVLFGQGIGVRIDPRPTPPISTGTVKLKMGGAEYDAVYAGPAEPWVGLTQINVAIPASALPPGARVFATLQVCNRSGACWNSNAVTLRR